MDLTDEQWAILKPLIPKPHRRADNRGRPWKDSMAVLDGVLWILKTGARWRDLPRTYSSYQTCHRRFQQWASAGVMERVLRAMVEDAREMGGLNPRECFIDGTFVIAKRGATGWERPSKARVRRSWQW